MMADRDISKTLLEQVDRAVRHKIPVQIQAGASKRFLGRTPTGTVLDISPHQGIVNYEPTELVITARSGTPLNAIEQTLRDHQQMLAFEPPHFGDNATLGGTIACNLSGPRRAYTGAARDYVLGTHILNGKGESLHFGGEVMKNVAGYDVSRLMTGAMGTLGVLLEVSLKVLPIHEDEQTLVKTFTTQDALNAMHDLAQKPLPISATCYYGDSLYIRLSGTRHSVTTAMSAIGGDILPGSTAFWEQVREHRHAFFDNGLPLWRLSLASDTAPLNLEGDWLYEWNGAQRWLKTALPAETIFRAVADAGGHATLYRHNNENAENVFQPMSAGLFHLQRRIKLAMDPNGVFNPGRLYADL